MSPGLKVVKLRPLSVEMKVPKDGGNGWSVPAAEP